MAVVLILFLLLLALVGYVAYVVHKKGIEPRDIRIRNFQELKKLLQPPLRGSGSGGNKYLQKRA